MGELRLNIFWVVILLTTVIFSVLYLLFSFFPADYSQEALEYFTKEQIINGKGYARIMGVLFISAFIIKIAFLTWFLFTGKASSLAGFATELAEKRYSLSLIIFFISFWFLLEIISLPFKFYSGFILQHKWGFSNQSVLSWWLDYFKETGLQLIITLAGVLLLFYLLNTWPRIWWIIAAILLSIWLVVQTYLWPIVVAPLFNDFQPVADKKVVTMVKELADKADLPVKEVLKVDASRRTTKANAYFAGLGNTRRIVLYDNLLKNYEFKEIKAVVAHEMAHWKLGHISKGLILGALWSVLGWGILYLVLQRTYLNPLFSVNVSPAVWALIIYFFLLTSFVAMPLQNSISRKMEREADLMAVSLTEEPEAAIQLQRHLAINNFSDISPHPFIEWFSYSHPSTLNRIRYIKNWGH